ncbi:IS30 family transposase [Exiguobacterium alkaliphilum]|uniref:IS30 family transposase n=1 Tax=Exiguobacterium alkaliphilum TaxID=1428684 RepID=UPI001BA88E1F|nr:IS30 family transposase [Exiguobacterium alkaliphilum]QUE86611.1 IS30 family transposase [Exiguobacterium alkaliphilum]
MSYTHLTTAERVKIETYLELGMSIRSIARRLGRQPSTVSREIRRNPGYKSDRAQERYVRAKANCGAKTKLDDRMRQTIIGKLRATWSPEQIVGRLFNGKIAFSTIYRWIYSGLIDVPTTALRQKGKRRKPVETRGRFNVGLTISDRPQEVRTRETFGHWELDTVVSGRGKSKACVATFVERKSRFYLALPIADRSAASMEGAIHTVHAAFPEGTFRTATTDRGKEFSCHENANGLLREFFPKGSDFATVGQGEIVDALAKINGRPRKCLGWKTAHEAFAEEVLRLI